MIQVRFFLLQKVINLVKSINVCEWLNMVPLLHKFNSNVKLNISNICSLNHWLLYENYVQIKNHSKLNQLHNNLTM